MELAVDTAAGGEEGEGLCSPMVYRESFPKAGLGALPGVGLSLGAVFVDIARQFISNSLRHCLIRSNTVQMLPL